jgi:hypothetical protein
MVAPLLLALAEPLTNIVGDLIDRAFPNSAERESKKLEYQSRIIDVLSQTDIAQIAVNKTEAKSDKLFVAGWRPFIGWTCGVAFCYHFILQPFMAFVISNMGYVVVLPVFDMDVLNTVLMGMLGLGTMRSFEKIKGTASTVADSPKVTTKGPLPWNK